MGHSVTIIGGGLAGMVAALRLKQRGFDVTIIEKSQRLGGKAGADRHGSDFDEHGWHLFPLWYVNIWDIADEIGLKNNFIDKTRYAYMNIGDYPKIKYLENPFSFKTAFHNIFNGIMDPINSFLYQYTILDLMSQPVRKRAELDQVTVNGFARSRFYCNDKVVDQLEDTVSRASAIESFEMSAMTVRNVMRYWFKYNDPWFRVLNGDLQSKFISPIEKTLRASGCNIILNAKVTRLNIEDKKLKSLSIKMDDGDLESISVDNVLLTTPIIDTRELIDDSIAQCAPELKGTFYLRSRIMAGMTIYFKKKIEGVPKEHVNFVGSPYSLSMIDVTDIWNSPGRSIICIVASDYTTLQKTELSEATRIIMEDLKKYLPFIHSGDIDRIDLQPHVAQPLFANTAGAWPRRPACGTSIENLIVAGDYCRSHVDLTCMEGAVSTGLLAAEAIRSKVGIGEPIRVLVPETHNRMLIVCLKIILMPAAIVAWLWTKFRKDD